MSISIFVCFSVIKHLKYTIAEINKIQVPLNQTYMSALREAESC